MNRREFTKRIFGYGAAFSAATLVLPKSVKSQILKPVINEYCRTFWDQQVHAGLARIKNSGPRLLLGDTHLHSTNSDGRYSVDQILLRARLLDLDYLVLTEHITPDWFDVESPLSTMRDLSESVKKLRDNGIVPPEVYPAAEISSREGHVITLFPKSYLGREDFYREFRSAFAVCGEKFMDAAWVMEMTKKLGGKAIVPHPGLDKGFKPFGIPISTLETDLKGLPDAIEDMNTGNGYFDRIGERLDLAPMGASDDHFKALIGTSVTSYDGGLYGDLTDAIADKATQGFKTAQVNQTLLKASLFFYSLRV
ncbi:MAG: hypothetical protein HZA01_16100 [Nitrospinae bacterium]|nr:hypothetical protein [Nitrospinota bacterium]